MQVCPCHDGILADVQVESELVRSCGVAGLQFLLLLPVQRVFLVGPQRRNWMALYPMRRNREGEWRIDGCVLIPSEGSST